MNSGRFSRREVITAIGAGALGSIAMPGLAQTGPFPNRPIKIIMPWAAGGGGDVLVRAMVPSLSARLGQPVVVENRPGAIGTIGSLAAARSPADGYTLVYGAADSHSIAPHIMKQPPYDSRKDFVAVAPIGFTPLALVVHASHPAKTFEQFLQVAREAKPALTFGSWGQGSSGQITVEALKQVTKVDLLHVPYNGTAPLIQAQLANQITCSICPIPVAEQHARAGTVRMLVVAAKERLADFKDIPTMRENGIAIDMGPWLGFLAPAGVPADVLAKLHGAIEGTLAEPAVAETMKKMTMVIERMDQRSYQAFYNNEYERWGNYIRTAKVSIDQ
ncbi:MAG: tripartite tricarboxylate transporter substrate binding protein [Rhodoferax sp.]|nr:tripartite tricarboxylate transporter substrate binding protein [Rhodoferax sp.]